MLTSDFDYVLPPELIAQEPLPERSQSRMMVVHCASGRLEHRRVSDLPEYLRPGDLLVVNDTRVIPARLHGRWTDTGGRAELLLVEETDAGIWSCLCRNSRRARPGRRFEAAGGRLTGEVVGCAADGRISVRMGAGRDFLDLLEQAGEPPVPPYIRRTSDAAPLVALDRQRYQTVFARQPGAVAAPTAGLHFTPELLAALERGGVARTAVTLHVGPGTFKPVKADVVEDHVMEAERYEIGEEAVRAIGEAKGQGGRIVAVGSTTVRTLETAAGCGGGIEAGGGRSALYIYPPYSFRLVDIMLTNFHLPKSTLLMMVCALAGFKRVQAGAAGGEGGLALIQAAYREAVQARYRFYSYGDCMLIL